ncbi:MAG TPA: coproporphyrinogen III oxidase, partial [Casimicrobium sp.]|nr:coproporphyrinogen III oxidase [Casimicrobium sp.]
QVDWVDIATRFHIDPTTYFANEQAALAQFNDANIIAQSEKKLVVTPRGRLLLRAVAMVFDVYKNAKREQTITFSRIA